MNKDIQGLVDYYQMSRHPEGGYYKEVYRSSETLSTQSLPDRYGGTRSLGTSIYFLLPGEERSVFHRIKSDEIWHYYSGDSLYLITINPQGELNEIWLGPQTDKGQVFQWVIPQGWWMGSICSNPQGYTLVGCTVSPGFDFDDFEIAQASVMLKSYPQHKDWIEKLI